MPVVTYTALRDLDLTVSPVHTAGTVYQLEFNARVSQQGRGVTRVRRPSIGRRREGIRHGRDRFWTIAVGAIEESAIEAWWEFLGSVDGGESFIFDPTGTIAVPGPTQFSAELETEEYEMQRIEFTDRFFLTTLRFLQTTT